MANHPLVERTVAIVSAYVSNNSVTPSELPTLILEIHSNLTKIAKGVAAAAPAETPREPAVSIRRSVTPDYLICLEDGMKFKSLKRHLASAFGLTPEAYRAKWGLPRDYPMVAPSYSKTRSALAKQAGLGQKPEEAKTRPTKTTSSKAAA